MCHKRTCAVLMLWRQSYKPLLAFLAGKRQFWGLSTSNTFFPFLNHGAIRVATCRANPGCLFGELL